jgi:hypothetical protein
MNNWYFYLPKGKAKMDNPDNTWHTRRRQTK